MPELVVVPPAPGPLVRPDGARRRDELDDLVDELFPDSDEGPGWFDGVLVAGGGGLTAWGALAGGPAIALALGPVALALGCVLPARAMWRAGRRRRREATLGRGLPLDAADPSTARLVAAYERLLAAAGGQRADAVAAGHGALSEVASLLRGRPPSSERERSYVAERAAAIEDLAAALAAAPDRSALLAAREELDEATGTGSLVWLRSLTEEERSGHDDDA
ncbi:MAG TPA: hypothetical protein VF640_07885 [Acidimicrobiales bacterium]